MRPLLQGVFVVLIGLGIASQVIHARRSAGDKDPRAALAARLRSVNVEAIASSNDAILIGRRPSCEQPVIVALLRIDGSDGETVRELSRSESVVRYVYLGSVEDHLSRPELIGRWVWATILFDLGLRPVIPSSRLVMVALPRSCGELTRVDWAALSPRR